MEDKKGIQEKVYQIVVVLVWFWEDAVLRMEMICWNTRGVR
jgi:hypothetical protein